MTTLIKHQEKEVVLHMAKEFLEYRLGIEANSENVCCLAAHIVQFEKEVEQRALGKKIL